MTVREIGKVVHCFDHVSAAELELSDELKVGDHIKIAYHGQEFEQMVESMEVDHHKILEARAGDDVAIKTKQLAHEHAHVYKLE